MTELEKRFEWSPSILAALAEARNAALEEAAAVCENENCDQTEYHCNVIDRCAGAIRNLRKRVE